MKMQTKIIINKMQLPNKTTVILNIFNRKQYIPYKTLDTTLRVT